MELVASMKLRRGELDIDVALSCKPGITCVMGPSGAGKSTILGVLAGLVVPDRGKVTLGETVWFDHEKRLDVPVHHRRLSYMFQNLALFPHMAARQNVEYGMHDVPREPSRMRMPHVVQETRALAGRQLGQTWHGIADALLGVVSAKAVEFISDLVPGFRDHYAGGERGRQADRSRYDTAYGA